jgi:hypothetical protein
MSSALNPLIPATFGLPELIIAIVTVLVFWLWFNRPFDGTHRVLKAMALSIIPGYCLWLACYVAALQIRITHATDEMRQCPCQYHRILHPQLDVPGPYPRDIWKD